MKMLKTIAKSTFLPFLLLAFVALMITTSCQREDTLALNAEDTENAVDFRATVLQLVYGIPADQVDSPESAAMYNSMMENMTGDQLAQLQEFIQSYEAQMNTTPARKHLGFRNASETTLSSGVNGDGYGGSIAKSGNTLFVGASLEGKVYVYVNNNLSQTLTGPGYFGGSIASSGNWLAVSGGTNPDGVVVLFKKQGNSWIEQATINPGFQFFASGTGADIAMHGNTLAVMGRNLSISNVQVYKLTGNSWSLETTLEDGNTFWWDMDLHANTIVMNGGSNIGGGFFLNPKVYIYDASGLTTVPFPQPGNGLARWVAIHNSTIVANVAFNSTKSYVITPSSGTWAISDELVNPNQGSQGSSQGRRLAIEGSKVVVTYPTIRNSPTNVGNDANDAAFVFEQSDGVWNLTETLAPSTGGLNIEYGYRALVKGNQVILGAPNWNANTPGAVFIHE